VREDVVLVLLLEPEEELELPPQAAMKIAATMAAATATPRCVR
jgi:hypothetical protein